MPGKWISLIMILAAVSADAALVKKNIDYKEGGKSLQGYLVYDDSTQGRRPGVLVVHEWWGLDDYAKNRAAQVAGLGYVAFAADIYGKGAATKDMKRAQELSNQFKNDRSAMRRRAQAALKILAKQPQTDASKLAAMGYCFGGGVALELARSGADLKGTVSFHGNLDTPNPGDAKNIKGKVLVFQGGDDKFTLESVPDFEDEMRMANLDWQLVEYGGAVHGFTNPANGNDPSKGLAYHPQADMRSWQAMKQFFEEIFK